MLELRNASTPDIWAIVISFPPLKSNNFQVQPGQEGMKEEGNFCLSLVLGPLIGFKLIYSWRMSEFLAIFQSILSAPHQTSSRNIKERRECQFILNTANALDLRLLWNLFSQQAKSPVIPLLYFPHILFLALSYSKTVSQHVEKDLGLTQ